MKKAELLADIAEKTGLPKTAIADVLDALGQVAQYALWHDKTIHLPPLGTLKLVERAARTRRNPRTGEPVEVPAHMALKFKTSAAFVKG
jgi:DNA-binding protein HU-beta